MKLNKLKSAGKDRKRVGRGGSRGGTSGKGHKGQKARSGGGVAAMFEGGQMPLTRRLPKRGFNNARFKTTYEVVSLEKLENLFEPESVITKQELQDKRVIKNSAVLVKILATGTLNKKLIIHADAFSKKAIEAIKNQGGEVHII